jgi:hypothetical protein
VIVDNYGFREGVGIQSKLKALRVSRWRNIRNCWGSFSNIISFKVGDESRICFWHDVWCGDVALKYSFPKLYS